MNLTACFYGTLDNLGLTKEKDYEYFKLSPKLEFGVTVETKVWFEVKHKQNKSYEDWANIKVKMRGENVK